MNFRPFQFAPTMVTACERTIDMKVFYQDAFAEQVIKLMNGFGCEPVLLETRVLPADATFPERRSLTAEIETAVKASPRGSYVLLRKLHDNGNGSYQVFASDGTGEIAVGNKSDHYDEPPTGTRVLSRMVGYEIFLCREHVEKQRKRAADVEALLKHQFRPGLEYSNLVLPGEGKAYSTVTIESVSPGAGGVTLIMCRRGTKNRWRSTIGAQRLAQLLADRVTPASVAKPTATAQSSLFAA